MSADAQVPMTPTPDATLEEQIMSWSIPKNEREWWAKKAIDSLREQNAEVQMRAFKWMERHDLLMAGKADGVPFPSPADLPQALQRVKDLEQELFDLRKALPPR